MTTKHTPGPWINDDGMIRREGFVKCDSHIIAYCPFETDKNREANARLIAAAPDLLAALKRVNEILTCTKGLLSFDGEVKDLMVKLIGDDVVSLAIAKAEGGES